MRWLVVHPGPHFSVADVYAGWVEALRDLGQKVAEFEFGNYLTFYEQACLPADGEDAASPRRFKRALTVEQAAEATLHNLAGQMFKTRPDVLLVVSGIFVDLDLLDHARRVYGTKVVVVHTESPYEDVRQIGVAAHADINLLNDPTSIDSFRAVAPTWYVPHAYRPHLHRPGWARPELRSDLCFVGTAYPSRVDFFERMGLDGLDVTLAGNWQNLSDGSPLGKYLAHDRGVCAPNVQAVQMYRATRASINIYRRELEEGAPVGGWSMGPREVELAATGCFFLRDPRPESDEVLPMLPTFAGPEDAGEQLRWWLDRDDLRAEAAAAARDAVVDRTFTTHAAHLLRLLDA